MKCELRHDFLKSVILTATFTKIIYPKLLQNKETEKGGRQIGSPKEKSNFHYGGRSLIQEIKAVTSTIN